MSDQPTAGSKRGRPRAAVPGITVSTWLRTTEYDRLLRQAQRRDESLSAMLRRLLIKRRARR